MTKYDLHTHFYPDFYLDFLARRRDPGITVDDQGRRWLIRLGHRFGPIVPSMYDIELRVKELKEIDPEVIQVLSLSGPGVDFLKGEEALQLARRVNGEMAQLVRSYPDRFLGLACLPLAEPGAVEEMERIMELGLKGIMTFSNIDGLPLDDPKFLPIYARAQEWGLPIFIHPREREGPPHMKEYRLMAVLGFEADLGLAVVRLMICGVLDKFPELKLWVAHIAGGVPFLIDRVDRAYLTDSEYRRNMLKPPSAYLGRFHYDVVSFYREPLRLACQLLGAERIVFGSDHPYAMGGLREGIDSIERLPISDGEREAIFQGNARRLLGI